MFAIHLHGLHQMTLLKMGTFGLVARQHGFLHEGWVSMCGPVLIQSVTCLERFSHLD